MRLIKVDDFLPTSATSFDFNDEESQLREKMIKKVASEGEI